MLISETETSSDVAIDVLNDLINYDKIDTGTLKIEISAIYFWDIVTTAVTPFYVQARHLNVELVLDMELQRNDIDIDHKNVLKRLLVLGDRVKLSQVIKNLISNALKFTSSGGKVTLTGDVSVMAYCMCLCIMM